MTEFVPLMTSEQGFGAVRGKSPQPDILLRTLPTTGNGYLSSKFPDAITSVDKVPVSATVRILYRSTTRDIADGVVVAEVQSKPDGTWRVDGLNPNLLYDVVGRIANTNDVIMSQISPATE